MSFSIPVGGKACVTITKFEIQNTVLPLQLDFSKINCWMVTKKDKVIWPSLFSTVGRQSLIYMKPGRFVNYVLYKNVEPL